MEGTTYQHVHEWKMAMRRLAPVLHHVEALKPASSMEAGDQTAIDRLPVA